MANPINASTLSGIHAFRGQPQEVRERLARRMRGRTYRAGAEILTSTQVDRDVYFLIAGEVRASLIARNGREVSFQELGPGAMFGELAAIDGEKRSTNVLALSDCTLGVMRQADFMLTCRELPEFAEIVMRRLAALSRMLLERVFEFSTLGVNNRIHAELLRLARDQGDGGDPVVIDRPPTHAQIASRVSTHREAVTRELKRLESLGVIEWRRSAHRILDLGRLRELVDDAQG